MKDLRLTDQKQYIYNAKLFKITFPEFWIQAYKNKNNFFDYVFKEAKQFIDKGISSANYLKDDLCKILWERHCEFCFKKITILSNKECYCTVDCFNWICADCYEDFKDQFNWQVNEVQDIPDEGVTSLEVKINE